MTRDEELRDINRKIDFLSAMSEIEWFWSLPRKWKLIVQAGRFRRHLERTWERYEGTIKEGINTPEKARSLWIAEAERKLCLTVDDFQEGETLDDLRDYRLTCELHNLPVISHCFHPRDLI